MATEEVYTIGSGGDYSTFAAYVAAKAGNLVTQDVWHHLKVKAGSAGVLDLTSGFTTDETHNIIVEPESDSVRFDVDDAAVWSTAMDVVASMVNASGLAGQLGAEYVDIDGILMVSSSVTGDVGVSTGNNSPAKVENCMLVQVSMGANVAKGFHTGTGFTGHFLNCLAFTQNLDFTSVVNFNVDCAVAHEAIINCTSVGEWNDADFTGVILKNYAKAINTISANSVGTSGKCFDTDSNKHAVVEACAAIDGSIAANFEDSNIIGCYESLSYASLFDTTVGKLAEDSPVRKIGVLPETIGANKDAFSKERIKFDLGYHQTNLVNSYDIEVVFRDIGSIVRTINEYETTVPTLVEIGSTLRVEQFTSDRRRLETLYDMLGKDSQNITQLNNWVSSCVTAVSNYLDNYVKPEMMGIGQNSKDILAELDYWLEQNSDKLNAIEIANNVVLDVDDATTIALTGIVISEIVKSQRIVIECISTATSGQESWRITGSDKGTFRGTATTNQAYQSGDGELEFKVELSATAWDVGHGTYNVNDIVENDSGYYICTTQHTAASDKEPGTGDNWADYWENYIKVGDKLYLYVTTDEDAVFQNFFRDHFDYVFANSDGNDNETILDGWAE